MLFFAPQDLTVEPKFIIKLWRMKKISHETAIQDFLRCRAVSSLKFIQIVQGFEEKELQEWIHLESQRVIGQVFSNFSRWRRHQRVNEYLAAVDKNVHYGKKDRAPSLLLRGGTQTGKTSFAIHLCGGPMKALVVNCQGMGEHLPSVEALHRRGFYGIVWDEITREQVLSNKKIFQASVYPVTLGQSACNQHSYDVWPYLVKNILCSNKFEIDDQVDPSLSAEDANWLKGNVIEANLPAGKTWYLRDAEFDYVEAEPLALAAPTVPVVNLMAAGA